MAQVVTMVFLLCELYFSAKGSGTPVELQGIADRVRAHISLY
jgi:ABC-type transporter Mla MlaB component